MARRRRKSRRKSGNSWKRPVKKTASVGSAILASVPILYPMVLGVQQGIVEGPQKGFNRFIYEATGWAPTTGSLDEAKFKEVATRDGVCIIGAIVTRWMAKRI